MGCQKTLSLTPAQTGDMGLDAAVYEPNTGEIFGVRGQWIMKFSAADGSLVSSLRFTSNAASTSDICTLGGKLYCCSWYLPLQDYTSNPATPLGDVFVVDAATFTVIAQWNLTTNLGVSWKQNFGYFKIAASNTLIATVNRDTTVWATNSVFSSDPANIPGTTHFNPGGYTYDIAFDSFNNAFWIANQADIYATSVDVSVSQCFDNGLTTIHPFGITYNAAQNKVYAVQGTEAIIEVNAGTALPGFHSFPVTILHTSRINANPVRVKSCNNMAANPYNGKVLIPAWADDTVLVWNPATDNPSDMVVKTGFTAPIDVVHCPTASFAVQSGQVGLLII